MLNKVLTTEIYPYRKKEIKSFNPKVRRTNYENLPLNTGERISRKSLKQGKIPLSVEVSEHRDNSTKIPSKLGFTPEITTETFPQMAILLIIILSISINKVSIVGVKGIYNYDRRKLYQFTENEMVTDRVGDENRSYVMAKCSYAPAIRSYG